MSRGSALGSEKDYGRLQKEAAFKQSFEGQGALYKVVKIGKPSYLSIQGKRPADASGWDEGWAGITEVTNPLE